MYVNDNKIHGSHGFGDQIESLHDFIQGIVRTLPPANHDGTLTHGTIGDLMNEPVNDERNALVHHLVQIGRDTRHLRHHANLKPEKNISQRQGHEKTGVLKKNHSPTTGDPSYDGNGGTHFSGGHATARPFGSTIDLRPGVEETLSGSIWAIP